MEKHRFKILIIVSLLISGILVSFTVFNSRSAQKEPTEIKGYAPPVVNANEPEIEVVGAPNGKMTLEMKKEQDQSNITYTFSVSDNSDSRKDQIFKKVVSLDTTISIPFNTFSPDNKYIFLKEVGASGTTYFVLSTTGTPISDSGILDISNLFEVKYGEDYKITDVTGWGGPSLIVVNTDKVGGGEGPSFWFEAGNSSFIQLSSRFN